MVSALESGAVVPACDYRFVREDGFVRHVRATVVCIDDEGEDGRRLVGTLQDISSQDAVARNLAAHAAVSKALDEWRDVEQGAQDLLGGLASAMNLPSGALWVTRGQRLHAAAVWHRPSSSPLAALADATLR